jgi:hypothetical protein
MLYPIVNELELQKYTFLYNFFCDVVYSPSVQTDLRTYLQNNPCQKLESSDRKIFKKAYKLIKSIKLTRNRIFRKKITRNT